MEKKYNKIYQTLLLIIIITMIWCWLYNKTGIESFKIPINYSGDSLFGMAVAKAYSEQLFTPFEFKIISRLFSGKNPPDEIIDIDKFKALKIRMSIKLKKINIKKVKEV